MNYFEQYNFFEDRFVSDIVEKLNGLDNNDCLVINYGHENYDTPITIEQIVKHYHLFKDTKKPFHLFFNQTYTKNVCDTCQDINKFIDEKDYSIFNVDLLNTYLPKHFNVQKYNNQYTNHDNKVLLQFGHFGEKYRLAVLFTLLKFIPKNLLYSFYPHLLWENHLESSYYNEVIEYHDVNKNNIKNFLLKHSNELDLDVSNGKNNIVSGHPFETWPFEKSGLVFICETNHPFETNHNLKNLNITEKTYRVILNHNPFILFGAPEQITQLKRLGFYTFNDFFPITQYNDINYVWRFRKHTKNYIEQLVKKNVIHFINNVMNNNNHVEEIRQRCNYNSNLLSNMAKDIIKKTPQLQNSFDLERYFHSVYNYKQAYSNIEYLKID